MAKAFGEGFYVGFIQILQFDAISFRTYLYPIAGWSHKVIDFVELMTSQTDQLDHNFVEAIMQSP
jgi:hypothetical protein